MKRYLVLSVLALLALSASFMAGSMAGLLQVPIVKSTVNTLVRPFICRNVECGYSDLSDRQPTDCSAYSVENPRTMVLLALGQSNSANHGETVFTPTTQVDNFNTNDGRCYKAKDPLLGATGHGGSPWTRMAEGLITANVYDRVLIASIGVGGSKIERWAPGGDLNPRIARTAKAMGDKGLRVTHIAWHQGEGNSNDTQQSYIDTFGEVHKSIRDLGLNAPIFTAIATICVNHGSDEIRAAQAALPSIFSGVFAGANTDALDQFAYRYDLCHLSELGLQKHADLWQHKFTAQLE